MISSVRSRLEALSDSEYKKFNGSLIPSVDANSIIGVRTPALKSLAKDMIREGISVDFIKELPHKTFEENQLHAFIIAQIKDYDICLAEVKRFLPYIDNWATCDQLSPKAFAKNTDRLLPEIHCWLGDTHTYTIRFGLGCLMSYYLDDKFRPEYLERAAAVRSDEYYVNMMTAWLFATALAKQPDAAMPYFEKGRLDEWVRRKAIQKSRESRRVDDVLKEKLKLMI